MLTEDHRPNTIYVGNICKEACLQEELIHAAFIPFGEILGIQVTTDPATGQPLGYAHIEYGEADDCQHAILNMNGSEFFGKTLKVM